MSCFKLLDFDVTTQCLTWSNAWTCRDINLSCGETVSMRPECDAEKMNQRIQYSQVRLSRTTRLETLISHNPLHHLLQTKPDHHILNIYGGWRSMGLREREGGWELSTWLCGNESIRRGLCVSNFHVTRVFSTLHWLQVNDEKFWSNVLTQCGCVLIETRTGKRRESWLV